jgi:hypothetical protein
MVVGRVGGKGRDEHQKRTSHDKLFHCTPRILLGALSQKDFEIPIKEEIGLK